MDKKYMNCTRCELCGTSSIIFSTPFVEYSILFRLLAAPLATMGVAMLSAAIFKSNGIHSNAKIILMAMTLFSIICNIGVLIDALYKFFISNVMPDDMQCDYQVFHPQYFIGIRNLEIIGATALASSTFVLAIERTIATVFYRSYNTTVRTPVLGLVLVIIQLIGCVIPVFHINVPKQMYPYSPPEVQDYKMFHYISMCETLINLISIMVFIILWIINRYRTKVVGTSHLQVVLARYDLHDNISTTKLMGPVVVILSLMVFSSEIIFLMAMPEYDIRTIVTHEVLEQLVEYAPYAEFQLSLVPILTILMILALPLFSSKLRKSFLCVSHLSICFNNKVRNSDTRSSSESSDVYFGRIHWNNKSEGLKVTPQLSSFSASH